jgi:L-ascorbate metabolism protein UlaG (beta-lactamase superfamily)
MNISRISRYAWFKIVADDVVIHIDPGYAGYYKNQHFDKRMFSDKADIVLITHHHKDHIQPKAIDKIRGNRTRIFATRLCDGLLTLPYQAVEPGFSEQLGSVKINTVYAYNTPEGHSTRKPHHKGQCVGYVIEVDGRRIYHAGDTDFVPEMSQLGKIDIAFLPIGGIFTMDANEALEAARIIKPKLIVPMHALKSDPKLFAEKVGKEHVAACIYLEPGQSYELA